MAPTPDPILDLTTERDRPTVRIDAVDYLLRTFNDLTLNAYKTLERLTARIPLLLLLDTYTADQEQELSGLLDQVCRLVLVAPAAVHDQLGDVHRLRVFHVFTQRLTPSLLRATSAMREAIPSTGPTPSHGSSGSIPAAATKTGPRGPRSASSRRH